MQNVYDEAEAEAEAEADDFRYSPWLLLLMIVVARPFVSFRCVAYRLLL
jgi:hypothetical protein